MSIIKGAGSKKPYSAGPSLPHTNEDTTKQPPFIYRKLEPSSIRLPIISAMEVTSRPSCPHYFRLRLVSLLTSETFTEESKPRDIGSPLCFPSCPVATTHSSPQRDSTRFKWCLKTTRQWDLAIGPGFCFVHIHPQHGPTSGRLRYIFRVHKLLQHRDRCQR